MMSSEIGQNSHPELRKFDALTGQLCEPAALGFDEPVQQPLLFDGCPTSRQFGQRLREVKLSHFIFLRLKEHQKLRKAGGDLILTNQARLFPTNLFPWVWKVFPKVMHDMRTKP